MINEYDYEVLVRGLLRNAKRIEGDDFVQIEDAFRILKTRLPKIRRMIPGSYQPVKEKKCQILHTGR